MGTAQLENETSTEVNIRQMPMYKVIMHNDDATTMDFVVKVLTEVFNKTEQNAIKIMLEIHNSGHGLVGIYPLEHAEFKVDQAHSLARARGFPLTLTIEPE